MNRSDPVERFWLKVEKADACWTWTGARTKQGYGWFFLEKIAGRRSTALAHRWAYEVSVGPIDDGLQIDHLCRNRLCVRPSHLEPVTQKVNILRGTSRSAVNARKEACVRDHPFSDANTYVRPDGEGRQCRQCKREDNAARGRRRRAQARANA